MLVAGAGLRALARRWSFQPVSDAGFAALPILDQAEQDDEDAARARIEALSWEVDAAGWRPIACAGIPQAPPRRFIDGSLSSRTVGVLLVDGIRRPLVLAAVGALELRLEAGRLVRPADGVALANVLCLAGGGLPAGDQADLAAGCAELGIRLVAGEGPPDTADFDVLRRRAFDLAKAAMEDRERELLLGRPGEPGLVDGLLERRLRTVPSHGLPVLGMVKRQLRQYLPAGLLSVLYELAPGQRTPAFVLRTEHARVVTWYLRLSTTELAAPSYGLVRMTMPLDYLAARFPDPAARTAEISALSAVVRGLRHRESSYARAGVSVEPIVRVEDELRALMPSIDELAARLRLAMT